MGDADRTTPIYSIGVVKEKTDLTGRQIRYYEECNLVKPARTEGNQRIYSQYDIERLEEIKELLAEGLNVAGVKKKLGAVNKPPQNENNQSSYDGRSLNTLNRRFKGDLTSLYPVSDRAQLYKVLNKKGTDQD